MRKHLMPNLFAGAMTAFGAASPSEALAQANPEQAAAKAPRAPELAQDDVRAFPAPPPGFADEGQGIARGKVEDFAYDSPVTGTRRSAKVYLPAGYPERGRYPVLYLLHGIGGNQDEWRGYVRAQAILDKLVAQGKAVPMIVVMPNGRALPDDRPPPAERIFTPEHVAGFAQFKRELLGTLIPAIDRAYATRPDREQRAIAGLSMGGGQALNIGLGQLGSFAWVGGFSPAPNTRAPAQLLPEPQAVRERLRLLYLSCGSQDNLLGISQALHRHARQGGLPHVWSVDVHGHDRESWAEHLYHFARLLFR